MFSLRSFAFILIPLWNARERLFSFKGRIGRKTYSGALGMHFLLALFYGSLLSGFVEIEGA